MQFKELNIMPDIIKALEEEGYETPTPIQEEAIPLVLDGRDLLGCAQTGTGKTAAFAIPTIQLLSEEKISHREKQNIRALVVTPTRELALQIYESFNTYGKFTDLKYCVIFGGVSQKPQEDILRQRVDILIATPGRLLALIDQKIVNIGNIKIFILDEADRMLDMGFINDVKKIIAKIPQKKQTLLFSATMPPDIAKLSGTLLKNPAKVEVTPVSSTVDSIEQCIYYVDKDNKKDLLLHILKDESIVSALVFTRTKHGADRIVKLLAKDKVIAQAIHGNKSQGARQSALNNFKNRTLRILIATDIAARGIDIDELSHVFNYDLPDVPETYVHRIGRTGRAGLGGIAISFCDFDEKEQLADIQKLIGKKIPEVKDHPYPLLNNFPSVKKTTQQRTNVPKKAKPQVKGSQKAGFRSKTDDKSGLVKANFISKREYTVKDHKSKDSTSKDYKTKDYKSKDNTSKDYKTKDYKTKDYKTKDNTAKSYKSKEHIKPLDGSLKAKRSFSKYVPKGKTDRR